MGFGHVLALTLLAAANGLGSAWAQAAASGPSIYTCVDAKGRRLTSDRPIMECLDREQQELTRSGTVKRVLKPSLSPEQAAIEEEKARRLAEQRQREAEEKRRERALLARYPERGAHDREREKALEAVQGVIETAQKRIEVLLVQRKAQEREAEFYKGDPARIPEALKRQLAETDEHLQAQRRFIANQEEEKKRVNARFDVELARLEQLWALQRRAPGSASGAGPAPR